MKALDDEYKLPSYTEEEIIENLNWAKMMGLRWLNAKLPELLGDSLTEEGKAKINAFINGESEKIKKIYENSTLDEKVRARIAYEKDPINILKKENLRGALDANNSGLFA